MTCNNKHYIFWITLVACSIMPGVALLLGPDYMATRWITVLAILNFRALVPALQVSDVAALFAYWILLALILSLLSLWSKYLFVVVLLVTIVAHVLGGSFGMI